MAGRKPKPLALKLLAGNPGKRRLPKNGPTPRRQRLVAPGHLSDTAKTAWVELAERLYRLGVATEMDGIALEQLCENYAEIRELRADILANGRTQSVQTKSGDVMERSRPAWSQLSDAERRFRAMMTEFGLTPSARTRIVATGEDESQDPAEAYFG